MPLRAIQEGKTINAYNLNQKKWEELKESRKKSKLQMPCCKNSAIPKTSKLGTQFFAHGRRGECTTTSESKEHLLAKTIIARICQIEGWDVTTEYSGETPNKEKWIADVYAKKGKVQIVFEVQWSSQTIEITRERQERYKASGIRSAWLAKKKKREYFNEIEEYQLPYFHIEYNEKDNNFNVPRYKVTLQEFIQGMLNKKLIWFPKKGINVESGLITIDVNCWRCKRDIQVIAGIEVKSKVNKFKKFYYFDEVSDTIVSMITPSLQQKHKIGIIKKRYSKTMQHQYLSNGCYYCDAIYGNFFLKEEILELLVVDSVLYPIKIEVHKLGKEIPLPNQVWHFEK